MKSIAIDGVKTLGAPNVVTNSVALSWQKPVVDWIPELLYIDPDSKARTLPSRRVLIASGATIGLAATFATYTALGNTIALPKFTSSNQVSAPTTTAQESTVSPKATPPPAAEAAAVAVAATSAQLQSAIESFSVTQNAKYFIYVKDLKTGASATLNADKVIKSASLYKAFVANQIYMQADQGLLNLSGTTGFGMNVSINECLNRMITVSDNPCGQALGARLGWHNQHGSFRKQGYAATNFFTNPTLTNAHDVGLLMENIYTAKYLKPESREALLGLLKAQKVNNRLPQGLPAGTTIAHKTGELHGYMHDAGIVFGPKSDYVIVAMSGPWGNEASSYSSQATLSTQIYNLLQK